MIDKHTLRANALAAMRAAIACDWAKVVLGAELQKQEVGNALRDEYRSSVELLGLQVEDELSKCHEALTAYYARDVVDDKPKTPYPWCPQTHICKDLGSCPRDPNCGE